MPPEEDDFDYSDQFKEQERQQFEDWMEREANKALEDSSGD